MFDQRLVKDALPITLGYCIERLHKTSQTTDPFYVVAGQIIRTVREGKKITQEQVGDAVGLSRTSINNIEKGRQKMLLDTFCKIARTLGEEPERLIASCLKDERSATVDKRLQRLPPEERQFIEEGIAKGLKRK